MSISRRCRGAAARTLATPLSEADKPALIATLSARIRADLDSVRLAQNASQAGATHSESRAEGAKDTRATESSYLARGLAERVEELGSNIAMVDAVSPNRIARGAAVAMGALVSLEDENGDESHYFLSPAGAGETLEVRGIEVRALTAASPLGAQLIGRREDDEIVVARPRGSYTATLVRVR